MSNFRHWATDSLRDKLQTLPIFVFILYQMDKPSGICIVSPNTKAFALHFCVVFALNSLILILLFSSFFFVLFGVRCVCVVLDFLMHFIYKCISKVFGFLCKVEVILGFVFCARACRETLIPSLFIYSRYY
jgi:hypothetical protein